MVQDHWLHRVKIQRGSILPRITSPVYWSCHASVELGVTSRNHSNTEYGEESQKLLYFLSRTQEHAPGVRKTAWISPPERSQELHLEANTTSVASRHFKLLDARKIKPILSANQKYCTSRPSRSQTQGKTRPPISRWFRAFVLSSELSSSAREYDICRLATEWQDLNVIGMVLRMWSNV